MSTGDMGKVLGKCLKAGEDPAVQHAAKATVAAALASGAAAFGEAPTTNQPPRKKKAGYKATAGDKALKDARAAVSGMAAAQRRELAEKGATVAAAGKVVDLHPECPRCRKRKPYCQH